MHKWKVACFDLDGTLVSGTSTGQFLAEKIGHVKEIIEAESLYQKGKISNAEVAELDAKYYQGYTVGDIHDFLEGISTVEHIAETVSYLAAKGIPSLICTLAWQCVAEYFAKRYGFVAWSGPELCVDANGVFTGDVRSHFDETDKPTFVADYGKQHGASLSEVFHVGDSRSDIPLFGQVGFSVALNADAPAKSAASTSLDSESLMDVLALVPDLRH